MRAQVGVAGHPADVVAHQSHPRQPHGGDELVHGVGELPLRAIRGSPGRPPTPGRSMAMARACLAATDMTCSHVRHDSGQPCRNR